MYIKAKVRFIGSKKVSLETTLWKPGLLLGTQFELPKYLFDDGVDKDQEYSITIDKIKS